MKAQLGNATTFMTYSHQDNAFIIQEGASNASDAGLYAIQISLMDQKKNEEKYSFNLNVTCAEEEAEAVITKKFPGVEILPEYEENENVKSLKPHIRGVSLSGLVTIGFNRPVKAIANLTLIEEGQVLVDDVPKPVLEIKALPGEFSNAEKLYLDWEVVNMTSTTLTIQLIWKNSNAVSVYRESDNLEIIINGYHLFAD